MILNQYARYRVNQTMKGKKLWHITYQEAFTQKIPIRIEYYKLMEIQSLQEGENLRKLWNRIQEQCEVSDIIVVNGACKVCFFHYPYPFWPTIMTSSVRMYDRFFVWFKCSNSIP